MSSLSASGSTPAAFDLCSRPCPDNELRAPPRGHGGAQQVLLGLSRRQGARPSVTNEVEENTGDEREAPESSLAGVISCLIGLGLLGYFLGARRLALVTVFVCVAALFFGLMASQGLIPGLGPFDHRHS